MENWIHQSVQNGRSAHEAERELFWEVLELGRKMFQAFLKLVGPGDFGESVTLDNERVVHRSEKGIRGKGVASLPSGLG
jgi:hypothetical protein